jgi:hypothetical protein
LAQKSHGPELAFHFYYGKLLNNDQGMVTFLSLSWCFCVCCWI